jgi:hypothetical protein
VFNAWAQDLNEKYVSNPATAPEFFLTRVGIFDNRFLSQDDAGTLRVLLAQYAPIDTEQGMVLFRRQPESSLLEPRPLGGSASNPNQPDEPSIAFDQPIDPPLVAPGEMLAIELSLPLNLAGSTNHRSSISAWRAKALSILNRAESYRVCSTARSFSTRCSKTRGTLSPFIKVSRANTPVV